MYHTLESKREEKVVKYDNIVIGVSNYTTSQLGKTLRDYGKLGYKLVNVTMANNEHNCEIMYLFFTKEI